MALTKITSRILDSSGVTILGTIATGVWQGTAINQTYLVGQSGTNTGDETLARINALDVTELGTISSGVWNGTAINQTYLVGQSGTNTGDETLARINALDVTELGTISSGVWQGSVIASAYLDADTAHLSTTQTFTGAKTFSSATTFQLSALTNPSGVDANTVLTIKNNGWSGITMLSSAAAGSFLTFGDADAGFRGRIQYLQGSTDAMVFETAASEKLRITSGGNVGIGTTSPFCSLDIKAASSGVQLQLGRTVTNVGSAWMGADSNGFHLGVGAYGAGNSVSDPNGLTISSGGNVGIGTGSTAPQHKLNVQVGTDSRLGVFGNGTYVGIGAVVDNNSAYRAMKLYATDYEFRIGNTPKLTISSGGEYSFGTPSGVTYGHGSNDGFHLRTGLELGFGNGNNNRPDFGINATGSGGGASLNIYCGEGSDDIDIQISPAAVMQFNSGGIKFGGTPSPAYHSGADTLDAYERGTFTPTNNGDATGTLGASTGEYTRIGNVVHFRLACTINANFTSNSVGGLPYTIGGGTSPSSVIGAVVVFNVSASNIFGLIGATTSRVEFFSDMKFSSLPPTTAMSVLRMSGSYRIN